MTDSAKPNSMPVVDIQVATNDDNLPSEEDFRRWIAAALPEERVDSELTVRIVGITESKALNHQYRQKDAATNVLSFPSDLPAELGIPFLGDLVICAAVVEREADQQNKTLNAHWAHMVVHGTLHLLGYDHIEEAQADDMEARETEILIGLNYAPPYE